MSSEDLEKNPCPLCDEDSAEDQRPELETAAEVLMVEEPYHFSSIKATSYGKKNLEDGDELVRKKDAETFAKRKFSHGVENGKKAARLGILNQVKIGEISSLEDVVVWACDKLESVDAGDKLEEMFEQKGGETG